MATSPSQISAHVSAETKALVERYTRAHGIKKGFLIETALLHHLEALQEIPADVIIPPRLVVSRASGEALVDRLATPSEPTPAMKKLFTEADDDDG